MKRRSQKGGEGMFENLFDKVKGYFTTNTNEQPENNNINQEPQSNSVTQDNRDSLESEQPTEPIQNEEPNNIVEKSENENQQGGKTKKKKKSLKLKKKKIARKTKSKKNKTKVRKHGSGSSIGKPQPEPKESQWKPKSGDHGIRKYYGQYVKVEGLNGNKNVGKLIKMNGLGDEPRSILIENDKEGTIFIANIKSVTHPDERIGEI
jgi:hypothetical protein|tara:strand:- start:1111 stop:1728 length:618 start_codon:yes stop_codon:yes gene_type:complete